MSKLYIVIILTKNDFKMSRVRWITYAYTLVVYIFDHTAYSVPNHEPILQWILELIIQILRKKYK